MPTSDTLAVNEPQIGNLPYDNALWYFGSGSPSAVPAYVGYQTGKYAYQYANLTFEKNCGGGDDCSGSPTWGEIDTEGAISVSSSGVLESTDGHDDCSYDSAVTATLDGWQISVAIFVNWPTGLSKPYDEDVVTEAWGDGFWTLHPWFVGDNCGNGIPSMALNEDLGDWSEHASVTTGWSDPPDSSTTWFPDDEWWFYDRIGADGGDTWVPDPVYTGPPPYDYNTKLKWTNDQKWFIGTTTIGSGHQVFDGLVEFYQDHGVTKE